LKEPLPLIFEVHGFSIFLIRSLDKGLSMKDVRSQGGVCLVFFEQGIEEKFFRCGRPHFLVQKTSDLLKFMVCPHGQVEIELVRKKEGGVNFSRICVGVFYGWPVNWF